MVKIMTAPGDDYPEACATCATMTLIVGPDGAHIQCTNPDHPEGPNRAA